MRKILHVSNIIIGTICFAGCIQAMFQEDMVLLGLATFCMLSAFLIAFIAEPRKDEKYDARCQSWGVGMLLLVTIAGAMLLLSSCSTSGYGCKGRSKCMTRVK